MSSTAVYGDLTDAIIAQYEKGLSDLKKLIARLPDVFLKIPSMSEDADPSYESLIDSFVEETKNIGPPFVVLDVWWPSCENLYVWGLSAMSFLKTT